MVPVPEEDVLVPDQIGRHREVGMNTIKKTARVEDVR